MKCTKQKTTCYAGRERKVIQNNHLSDYNGVVQATINKKGKVIVMAKKAYSLAHTKWMCKYHIVFTPKYRRKIIYNQYRKDLGEILRWCCEELPENKPRHLLGLSRPDDILIGAEMGADTCDCVAPTREPRHGRIYTKYGNIRLAKYQDSLEVLDEHCDCPTCKSGITRKELCHLYKSQDPEERRKYYKLASIHNLRFILRLTEEIRDAINNNCFEEYKNNFLKDYYHTNKK